MLPRPIGESTRRQERASARGIDGPVAAGIRGYRAGVLSARLGDIDPSIDCDRIPGQGIRSEVALKRPFSPLRSGRSGRSIAPLRVDAVEKACLVDGHRHQYQSPPTGRIRSSIAGGSAKFAKTWQCSPNSACKVGPRGTDLDCRGPTQLATAHDRHRQRIGGSVCMNPLLRANRISQSNT